MGGVGLGAAKQTAEAVVCPYWETDANCRTGNGIPAAWIFRNSTVYFNDKGSPLLIVSGKCSNQSVLKTGPTSSTVSTVSGVCGGEEAFIGLVPAGYYYNISTTPEWVYGNIFRIAW